MFQLLEENYSSVSREIFYEDLGSKDFVGLLMDHANIIQGFTTIALRTRHPDYNVLFSGDTIITPKHWGSQELVRGFCNAAGSFLATSTKPLYWFLISKGHRTYLYLPLFTRKFFPDPNSQNEDLAAIAKTESMLMFPQYYDQEQGLLVFPESRGELRPELIAATLFRETNEYIRFFRERNPGFVRGNELVCITELSPSNLKGIAKRWLVRGMSSNVIQAAV